MNNKPSDLQIWVAQRARELRRELTPCEQDLWQRLRAKRFAGYKFRRQEPIGRYIADFVCLRIRLVVELDGSQHQQAVDHDQVRDEWLKTQGFRVLRFWNSDWTQDADAVLEVIWRALEEGTA